MGRVLAGVVQDDTETIGAVDHRDQRDEGPRAGSRRWLSSLLGSCPHLQHTNVYGDTTGLPDVTSSLGPCSQSAPIPRAVAEWSNGLGLTLAQRPGAVHCDPLGTRRLDGAGGNPATSLGEHRGG